MGLGLQTGNDKMGDRIQKTRRKKQTEFVLFFYVINGN